MNKNIKIVRITTVPLSLQKLLKGQMRFMSENGFDVYMVSSDFDGKVELAQTEASHFIPLKMTRSITPLTDLYSLWKMFVLLKEIKPEIVHTHTPKAGLIGIIASWLVRVPIRLHTVAGLPLMESKGIKRFVLETVERLIYSSATKVYPNSNELKAFIVNSRLSKANKLKVLGNGSSNGIDTNAFSMTEDIMQQAEAISIEFNLSSQNFTFIFIGRLVKDKGIEELVKAFSNLSQRHSSVRLLLVGGEEPELDPISSECLTLIAENAAIIKVGYRDDVRPYLALSNVLTFPSYREGFPNVPMQAGCFDLPSIVTDINGCNEIVENEINGLIIPVKDENALMNAMERVYTDQGLYMRMRGVARKSIVERFDQQRMWDLILAEYRALLVEKHVV